MGEEKLSEKFRSSIEKVLNTKSDNSMEEELLSTLTDNRMNTGLESSLKENVDYLEAIKELDIEMEQLRQLINTPYMKAIDKVLVAQNNSSSIYARAAYIQGLRDGIKLIGEIMKFI